MTDLRLILPVTGRLRWIVICTAVTVRAISARPEASPQATARWCGSCMLPGGPDPPAPIGGPGSSSARAHTLRPGGPGDLPTVALARGPHSARRARPRGAQLQLGLQPAKRAAGGRGPTPGRCCGLGPRASPSHPTGDWARVPARTALAGMFVTDPQTAHGLRLVHAALPSTTTALAYAWRSRCKLWPRLRSTNAPWGVLRVRL